MNLGLETGAAAPALIAALRPHLQALNLWHPRALPRGTVLFGPDAPGDTVWLLTSGLVKLVYGTASGEEWIKSFVIGQGVFAPQEEGAPPYGAVCIDASVTVRLPRATLDRLAAEQAELRAAAIAFSQWVIRRKQAREAALLSLTPEQRYRALCDSVPDLLARLPQGDIARFLGITPIAFSRLKRRMGAAPA